MNIQQATNAFKVADFVLRQDENPNHIKCEWVSDVSEDILRDKAGRVYLLVSNGEIKKIGGSHDKGGIKSTMSFYENSMTGDPSLRSYGIHILIKEELEKGNNVELYMIRSETFEGPVKGLFGTEMGKIVAYKEMEEKCKSDYYSREGKYPDWNFQGNGETWRADIREGWYKLNNKNS